GQRGFPRGARVAPHVVERGEVEVALRREVPIQDRLRDPGGARDLGGRRTAVAALREDAQCGLDQPPAALGGWEPSRRDAHWPTSGWTLIRQPPVGASRRLQLARDHWLRAVPRAT